MNDKTRTGTLPEGVAASAAKDVRRVLVVDDSPKVRRTIREIVEDAGALVEECADGDEVLGAFERFGPHWVFMDVRMARLDGLGATRLLKSTYPDARIAIVTELDKPDLRDSAREAGAETFVPKSDLLVLLDLLNQKEGETP